VDNVHIVHHCVG